MGNKLPTPQEILGNSKKLPSPTEILGETEKKKLAQEQVTTQADQSASPTTESEPSSQTVTTQDLKDVAKPLSQSGEKVDTNQQPQNWFQKLFGITESKPTTQTKPVEEVIAEANKSKSDPIKIMQNFGSNTEKVNKLTSEFHKASDNVDAISRYPFMKDIKAISDQLTALGKPTTKEQIDAHNALVKQYDELRNTPLSAYENPEESSVIGVPDAQGNQVIQDGGAYRKLLRDSNSDLKSHKTVGELLDEHDAQIKKLQTIAPELKQAHTDLETNKKDYQRATNYEGKGMGFWDSFGHSFKGTLNSIGEHILPAEMQKKVWKDKMLEEQLAPKEATGVLGKAGEIAGGLAPYVVGGILGGEGWIAQAVTQGLLGGASSGGATGYETFKEAKLNGLDDNKAMEIANKRERVASLVGGAAFGSLGLIGGGELGKTAGNAVVEGLGGKVAEKTATDAMMNTLKEQGAIAGIFGADKFANNLYANYTGAHKDLSEGVVENMMMPIMLGAAIHGSIGALKLGAKAPKAAYDVYTTYIAKTKPDIIKNIAEEGIKNGENPQVIEKLVADVESKAKTLEKMPADMPFNEVQEQLPLLQQKEALIEAKKKLDPSFVKQHEELDTQIANIDNQIKSKNNAIQEQKTGSILQREPQEVGETGGGRSGVEQGKQGTETTDNGEAQTAQVEQLEGRFKKASISGSRSISELQKDGEYKFIDLGDGLVAWEAPKPEGTETRQFFLADANGKSDQVHQTVLNSKGEFYRLNEPNISEDAKAFGEDAQQKLVRLNEAKDRLETIHNLKQVADAEHHIDEQQQNILENDDKQRNNEIANGNPEAIEEAKIIDGFGNAVESAKNIGDGQGDINTTKDESANTPGLDKQNAVKDNTDQSNPTEDKSNGKGQELVDETAKKKRKIKTFTPEAIVRQKAINEFIDKLDGYNEMSEGSRGKKSTKGAKLRAEIKDKAKELGIHLTERGFNFVPKTKEGGSRVRKNYQFEGNKSEAENHIPLEKRSKETQELFDLMDGGGIYSFPDVVGADGKRMSKLQKESAIDDIRNGRNTKAADALLGVIDKANADGFVEINDNSLGVQRIDLDVVKNHLINNEEVQLTEDEHNADAANFEMLPDEERYLHEQNINDENNIDQQAEIGRDGKEKIPPSVDGGTGEKEQADSKTTAEPAKELSKLELARQRAEEARKKLDDNNIKHKIIDDPEERAKLLYDYHKALVDVAKEYIVEAKDKALHTVEEFAKYVGEKVESVKDAWDEATGKEPKKVQDFKSPEKEISTKNAVADEIRNDIGLPKVDIPADRTKEAGVAKGKELVDSGEVDPLNVVNRLLSDKDIYDKEISPNDEPVMRYYLMQLTAKGNALFRESNSIAEQLKSEPDNVELLTKQSEVSQQLLKHYDEVGRALDAERIGGNVWHKYGEERKTSINEQGQIINSINRIKTAYGDAVPPEVQKQLTELQMKHDELIAKNQKIEQDLLDKEAQIEALKAAKKAKENVRTVKKGDIEKRKAEVIGSIKSKVALILEKAAEKTGGKLNLVEGEEFPKELLSELASDITELMKIYASEGALKIDEITDKIHDNLKDAVAGITKDDIRDVIAGKYSEPSKTRTELQKQVAELRSQAKLQAKLEDLEKGIVAETKKRGESSPEVQELQKQVAELKKQVIDENANLSALEIKKRADSAQKKIDKGEFFKQPISRRLWEKDPEWKKNEQERIKVVERLRKMEREAMDSKKSMWMKGLDFTNRWGRRVIFFGSTAVYTKLSSAAVVGSFAHRIPEQLVGAGYRKLFPNIFGNAPIEGRFNPQAEAKFYQEFLNPKKFIRNTWDIAKTGKTDLSREFDKHYGDHHLPVIDLFAADSHIMIKDPVKRAKFESGLVNYLNFWDNNGVDYTHPLMLESARQAAYKSAENEIFQGNAGEANAVNKFFNDLEKDGIVKNNMPDLSSRISGNLSYTTAALYHFFVPINTVPVNIIKRVAKSNPISYTIKLGEAFAKNKAVQQGILTLSEEQSDIIARDLKKGAIGAAYWGLGLFLAGNAGGLWNRYNQDPKNKEQKRTDGVRADELEIAGQEISHNVQHTTQLIAWQMGATYARVYDHYINDKGASITEATAAASAATVGAGVRQIPTFEFGMNAGEAISTPYGGRKFVKDLKQRVGLGKAMTVANMMGFGLDENGEPVSVNPNQQQSTPTKSIGVLPKNSLPMNQRIKMGDGSIKIPTLKNK